MGNHKKCCECGQPYPEGLFADKTCYICTLKKWPPKNRSQYRKYETAVAIRLRLTTPISTQNDAIGIVEKVGLDNLQTLQDIIDEKVVSYDPRNTFYQRLFDEVDK